MENKLLKIAEYIVNLNIDDVPQNVVESAKYCVLDSIGAALGAADSKEIKQINSEYRKWTAPGDNGKTAAIWCKEERGSIFQALMVNGLMGHELELDDVHTESKSHIGAVVVTLAWTLADALNSTGKEFLEAVIVGYEAMGRVGKAMDVSSNRKRGWHTTGVIGTFGAAAAAAKLLKLNAEQTGFALGMAGTQSSGLWAFLAEGATCKKLHPARAILNGFNACLLAESGMTGPLHILDAKDGGLYQAVSDSYNMEILTENLGETYEITRIDKKPYPCCRTTHHAVDAALRLREEIAAEDIMNICVQTYDVGVLQCGSQGYPGTAVEAKFSIPYCCASAFVNGRLTRAEFSDENIRNPLIRQIAESTTVVSDELFTSRYPKRWGSRMIVTLKDGTTKTCQIDDMSGSAAVPLFPKQEKDKFIGLATTGFSMDRANEVMGYILSIESAKSLPDLS